MQLNRDLIANVLIGGSIGAILVSVFLATVVFDDVAPDSTAYEPEIEMGMKTEMTDQHIEVFNAAIVLIQTSVDILNISKVNDDGSEEPGGLLDLFPSSQPAIGKGTLQLRLRSITWDEMPSFDNVTKAVSVMAFIREETLNGFMRSSLKFAAVFLASYKMLTGFMVMMALGWIGLGTFLVINENKSKTIVEQFNDDAY